MKLACGSQASKNCYVWHARDEHKKLTFHRLDKQVNDSIRRTCQVILDECVGKVREVYHQMFPLGMPPRIPALPQDEEDEEEADDTEWDEDDCTPWIDVSFGGTWMKKGFTSHYGIGTVIDGHQSWSTGWNEL